METTVETVAAPAEIRLVVTSMFMRKSPRKGEKRRNGYADPSGMVFAPPKSEKRASAWKKRMEERGFKF
jgi:hypothetical protein